MRIRLIAAVFAVSIMQVAFAQEADESVVAAIKEDNVALIGEWLEADSVAVDLHAKCKPDWSTHADNTQIEVTDLSIFRNKLYLSFAFNSMTSNLVYISDRDKIKSAP